MFKSAFWVALTTSFLVAIVAYFVLFFLLRTDIVETRSFLARATAEQDTMLQRTFDTTLSLFQEAIVSNVFEVRDSVVSIVATRNVQLYMMGPDRSVSIAEQERQVWGWSGIIVSKSGHVLTNRHVVQDSAVSYTVILQDGKIYPVKNIWIDAVLDIAILALDIDAVFVENISVAHFISRDKPLSVGQFVFAIGNALTQWQNTVTFGILSAKNRELRMLWDNLYIGLLQTDTAINPGNSWGPLLDIYGNVIGINTAISTFWQWIWFALPITQEFVDATIAWLLQYGKIVRPFMGIVYKDISPDIQKKLWIQETDNGIYITDIVLDSPAYRAWLRKWDIIISLSDVLINNDTPFLYQLYTYSPWDMIRLHIIRSWDIIYRDVLLDAYI